MKSVPPVAFIYLPFTIQTQYSEDILWCPAFLSKIILFGNIKNPINSHDSDCDLA